MVGVKVITRSPSHGLVGAFSSFPAVLIAVRLILVSAATVHLKHTTITIPQNTHNELKITYKIKKKYLKNKMTELIMTRKNTNATTDTGAKSGSTPSHIWRGRFIPHGAPTDAALVVAVTGIPRLAVSVPVSVGGGHGARPTPAQLSVPLSASAHSEGPTVGGGGVPLPVPVPAVLGWLGRYRKPL